MDLVAMETDENIISKSNAFFNSFKFSFHFDFKTFDTLEVKSCVSRFTQNVGFPIASKCLAKQVINLFQGFILLDCNSVGKLNHLFKILSFLFHFACCV